MTLPGLSPPSLGAVLQLLCLAVALPLAGNALRRVLDGRDGSRPCDRAGLALWAGLTVAVLAAQGMAVALPGMPEIGYQGAALLAIVVGYPRAMVSLAVVFALSVPPTDWGSAMLVDALLPVRCTCALSGLVRRHGPPNPFLFLFGTGFFVVFAVGALQLAAGLGLDALGGEVSSPVLGEAFAHGLLLLGGEATLEGMVITVLTVYWPRSVALFDDDYYLSAARLM